jgi:hypothetical protein
MDDLGRLTWSSAERDEKWPGVETPQQKPVIPAEKLPNSQQLDEDFEVGPAH